MQPRKIAYKIKKGKNETYRKNSQQLKCNVFNKLDMGELT